MIIVGFVSTDPHSTPPLSETKPSMRRRARQRALLSRYLRSIEIDKESLDQGLEKILTTLHMLHYVTETRASILTEREEAAIRKRLKDLGYL